MPDHILRAIYHLMGALYMDEAGTRALTDEERKLTDDLVSWHRQFRAERAAESRMR